MDVEQLPEEEFTLGVSELFDLQIETLSLFFLLFDLRMFRGGRRGSVREQATGTGERKYGCGVPRHLFLFRRISFLLLKTENGILLGHILEFLVFLVLRPASKACRGYS